MSKPKKGEFVVHCIMCGKDFRVGDKAECGGLFSGKPMCRTGDIQRALDERLPKQTHSNALAQADAACGVSPGAMG